METQKIGHLVREVYLREVDKRSNGWERKKFCYVQDMAQARADRLRTWLLNRYRTK
jgi:hypothetical protein